MEGFFHGFEKRAEEGLSKEAFNLPGVGGFLKKVTGFFGRGTPTGISTMQSVARSGGAVPGSAAKNYNIPKRIITPPKVRSNPKPAAKPLDYSTINRINTQPQRTLDYRAFN